MNISFLTSNYFPRLGGMEYAAYQLANELNKDADLSVSVACSNLPEVPRDFPYPHRVYRSPRCWHLTPWLSKRNRVRMLKREHTDILHGHIISEGGKAGLELRRKFKLPLVVTSHGSDVQVVPQISYGECLLPERKYWVEKVIREADHLIALSGINKQDMLNLGADEDRISVIPNGIQWEEIGKIPYENLRSRHGIDSDVFTLITIGRNRPIKRLELLFEALYYLKKENIKCICVGPEKPLQTLAQRYKVTEKVVLPGVIPSQGAVTRTPYSDLVNMIRSADLYVSTSYRESFGIAAAEAMACGIPILIGEKHGIRDVVNEGENGYIFCDESPEHLGEMLRKITALKHDRQLIRQSVSHLDWSLIAGLTKKLYKKVLSARKGNQ